MHVVDICQQKCGNLTGKFKGKSSLRTSGRILRFLVRIERFPTGITSSEKTRMKKLQHFLAFDIFCFCLILRGHSRTNLKRVLC